MRQPLPRSFSGSRTDKDNSSDSFSTGSWLNRVRENFGQLLIPSGLKPSSANGAPIHLLKFEKSLPPARTQGASLITHAVIFAALLLLFAHGPGRTPGTAPNGGQASGALTIPVAVFRSLTNVHANDGSGRSGGQNPIPATRGDLPPRSSLILVRPMLPEEQHAKVPEPPAIFDANAAAVLKPTDKMGLPWMTSETGSAGPGKNHGIGSTDGTTLGDGGNGPVGDGTAIGAYVPGMIPPGCDSCPNPTYTEEARRAKVQGSVTLEVLVGEDGRAHAIRIVKGIGVGLDERAVETVQGWKFTPARDGAKRPMAAWVTVEAVFRLF
ncbi:MAG: energy transducer TonB [Candidatus Acidiferrum sp.]